MARVPLMVIRGGNSDVLSTATVAAMQARHQAMEAIEVPDQGHAPLLSEPALIASITAFAESCDRRPPLYPGSVIRHTIGTMVCDTQHVNR